MTDERTRSRYSIRAVIAGVVACLFILQGLAFAASHNCTEKAQGGADASIANSLADEHCGVHRDDGTPAQGRHDYSQCCIFCAASGRDAPIAFINASFSVASHSARLASVSVVRFFADNPEGHPQGWASSWSSRAPPHI
jgi:hypothetical protein